MPKATLQFGEWRPDLALLDNQYASIADNAFPALNCYKPLPSLRPFSTAMLPSRCLGLFPARREDGTWDIYAGTATKLYKWSWAGWSDVSRLSGGNYNVPFEQWWEWTQFGEHLIVVNGADAPQWINVETDSNFSALPGSPPKASNVHTIGDFVVLAGLTAGSTIGSPPKPTNLRQIIWSSINAPDQWSIGVNLCDFQEMPDGGPVVALAGDKIGYIVQDRAIRLMQFLPGDINTIFSISKVVQDKGSISRSVATVADDLYFMAEDGPYRLSGNQLDPIGEQKVSEWWLANSDAFRRNGLQIVPANKPYVIFTFYDNGASQFYNRVLIYNWLLQRWASGTVAAQQWAMLSTTALDLDTTGTEPGDQWLDSPPAPLPPNAPHPLDSFAYLGGRPLICAINGDGQLCALQGPNLMAIMQTGEAHLVPGMRAFVSEVYPLCDGAPNGTIMVETRERMADARVSSVDYPLEITGSASVLTSARLHRFTHTIPAGEVWTTAQGVLVEAQPDGHA